MKSARFVSVACCLAAAVIDGMAFLLIAILGARYLVFGAGLHALAVVLVGWMPPSLKTVQRSAVELRIGQVLSLAVPVIGPLVALMLRTRSARLRRQMQTQLEDFYAQFLDKPMTPRARSPFKGEFEDDVDRLSDAESFATVLRYGTADHRRGVLRRLGEHEGPQAMALLRHCLTSPNGEIALFAYGQLDQTEQELSRRIVAAEKRLRSHPEDGNAQTDLAEAHRAMARSGALDEQSSRWHEQEALRIAAVGASPVGTPVHSDVAVEAGPQANLLARAERAFHERDLDTVCEVAEMLRDLGAHLPVWLDSVRLARNGVKA